MQVSFTVFIIFLLLLNISNAYAARKRKKKSIATFELEIAASKALKPLAGHNEYIMFWRPQKVGSSTILSILLSYSFRYNIIPRSKAHRNSFCAKVAACGVEDNKYESETKNLLDYINSSNKQVKKQAKAKTNLVESVKYQMSINHEICNFNQKMTRDNLPCAFYSRESNPPLHRVEEKSINIKELFVVREPLNRMISVYYFWGELFRLVELNKRNSNIEKLRLGTDAAGMNVSNMIIKHGLFIYHGNESTVPSYEIAMAFAHKFPLSPGMPGPSFTWSALGRTVSETVDRVLYTPNPSTVPAKSETGYSADLGVMTVVTDRLDESLVVMSHYLNWKIADVVVTASRKALSSHPKVKDWPKEIVEVMRNKLVKSGEYEVFEAANKALDNRVNMLKSQGVNIEGEIELLRNIRKRVSVLCHSKKYLDRYKNHLEGLGYNPHRSENRLRDGDNKYADEGHMFSLNGEIVFSYDVCGNCEAHALQLGYDSGWGSNVTNLPVLEDIPKSSIITNKDFERCPIF